MFSSGLQSRAALSLLGYCYYHIQDFSASAECYEQLTQLHPEVEDYKVYYAQSLYKAGAYPEATKASFALENTSSHTKVPLHLFTCRTHCWAFRFYERNLFISVRLSLWQMLKLQACIKYCEEDNSAAKVSIHLDFYLSVLILNSFLCL